MALEKDPLGQTSQRYQEPNRTFDDERQYREAMFVGRNAATWDSDRQAQAENLEAQANELGAQVGHMAPWRETGLFRGRDGQWRDEISDAEAYMKVDPSELSPDYSYKLSDILEHPQLFEAYPDLREVNVTSFNQTGALDRTRGLFNPTTNTLSLSRDLSPEVALSTALHEVQHGVQSREGWAVGGNPRLGFEKLEEAKDLINTYGDRNLNEEIQNYQNTIVESQQAFKDYTSDARRWGGVRGNLITLETNRFNNGTLPTQEDADRLNVDFEDLKAYVEMKYEMVNQSEDSEEYLRNKENTDNLRLKMYEESTGIEPPKFPSPVTVSIQELQRAIARRNQDNQLADQSEQLRLGDQVANIAGLNLAEDLPAAQGVYESFAGETEARLTQSRKDMAEDERRLIYPPLMSDINPIHQQTGHRYAEGGLAMENQMNRLMAEGGLNDDGMTMDPVSGNEVPPGSMAEEVRDDIPAQLSGGEYVVPADVVRYYGVKFFEDLRGEAKMGLEGMEADGRIGGEPAMSEAAPAGLSEEDMVMLQQMASQQIGMAEGGMVQNNYLNEDQLIDNIINVAKGSPELMGKLNQKGVMLYEGGLVSNYAEGGFTPTFNPNDWATLGASYFGTQTSTTPIENKVYRGPNGESITIRFQNNVALDPIPQGYVPEDQYVSSALGSTPTTPTSTSDRDRDQPFGINTLAPTVSTEPKSFDENGMYRGVSFEDPVGAAKEAYGNTQGTFANRAIAGVAGFFGGPLAGQAAKEFVVGNNLAKIRANLRVAEEYGTPEQVSEIEKILKDFEDNSPKTLTTGGFFENVLWSGNKIFEDASNVWAETGGVRTPQGAIQAVSSGAGLDRAKKMTASEVQAGEDYAKKGDDRDTSWAGGQVRDNQDKPAGLSQKESREKARAAADKLGKPLATGGRARGGLMGKVNKT